MLSFINNSTPPVGIKLCINTRVPWPTPHAHSDPVASHLKIRTTSQHLHHIQQKTIQCSPLTNPMYWFQGIHGLTNTVSIHGVQRLMVNRTGGRSDHRTAASPDGGSAARRRTLGGALLFGGGACWSCRIRRHHNDDMFICFPRYFSHSIGALGDFHHQAVHAVYYLEGH